MKRFALTLSLLTALTGLSAQAAEPVFWLSDPYFPELRRLERLSATDPYGLHSENIYPWPETGELKHVWQDAHATPWVLMLDAGRDVLYRLRDGRWQAYPAESLNARMRALQQAFGITAAPRLGDLYFRQSGEAIEPMPIPDSLTAMHSPEGLWATVSKGSGPLLLLDDQGHVQRRIAAKQGFVPALRQGKGSLWAWKAASHECLEIGPDAPRLHRGCGRPVFEDTRGRAGFVQLSENAKDPTPVRISLYDRGRWIHRRLPGALEWDRHPGDFSAFDDGQGRLWLIWDSRMLRVDPGRGQLFDVDLGRHDGPGGKKYYWRFLESRAEQNYFYITGYDTGTCTCPERAYLKPGSEADFRRGLLNYDQNPSASFLPLIF